MHPFCSISCITLVKEVNGMNISKELYIAYKHGNAKKIEQLFSLVYKEYADLIFVVISKYVERYEDVEELTDDVFIQFFNHLENLKPEKEIKYYLMTSAKNIAINFLKKQRYVEVIDEELVGNYVQADTSYAHLIKDWQQFLTQEEINLILNHVLYGFSLKQLAEKNNKSSNTVKSQYRRSIKKLKQFYQEA